MGPDRQRMGRVRKRHLLVEQAIACKYYDSHKVFVVYYNFLIREEAI
jgi:hypothetical protein